MDEEDIKEESRRELIRVMTKSRVVKALVNSLLLGFYLAAPLYYHKNFKFYREFIFCREGRIGLLENAILQNPLHHPVDESNTLEETTTLAGAWNAYDFRRRSEFSRKANPKSSGTIISLFPDQIRDYSPDTYTPTGYVDLIWAENALLMEKLSLSELLERGLLIETTYEEAFARAGVLRRFSYQLVTKDIGDKPVFQVTPKGNGLVYLINNGGDEVKNKEKEPALLLTPKLAYH
ncbi:hypothetical protein HYX12_02065 [Candidatus Woesearchaeota archaeon]|nr:hypothetical protein [Candidatus Woesearchaeota archaeon]